MESPRTQLAHTISRIGARGWCPATSGNFSQRIGDSPLRLLMTPSGIDKSSMAEADLIEVSESGQVLAGTGKISAEFALHTAIYTLFPARTILHVHTVANTIISRRHTGSGKLHLNGFEILKAFSGVTTHEHTEVVPIFANTQNIAELSSVVRKKLADHPACHGFLLSGHGLYTWGASPEEAYRHLEAFEFLFEVLLRQ